MAAILTNGKRCVILKTKTQGTKIMYIQDTPKPDDNRGFFIRSYMLNVEMSKTELLLYALINSYTLGTGGCYWGTRDYLARQLNVSRRSVYRAISSLLERGLIAEINRNGLVGLSSTDKILSAKRKRAPEY